MPGSKPAENTARKQRGRPFEPGKSGNPKGRPKGSRNQATLLAEALLDGEAETLTRTMIEKASDGDTTAPVAPFQSKKHYKRSNTVFRSSSEMELKSWSFFAFKCLKKYSLTFGSSNSSECNADQFSHS
jgi:hypothetical protein